MIVRCGAAKLPLMHGWNNYQYGGFRLGFWVPFLGVYKTRMMILWGLYWGVEGTSSMHGPQRPLKVLPYALTPVQAPAV